MMIRYFMAGPRPVLPMSLMSEPRPSDGSSLVPLQSISDNLTSEQLSCSLMLSSDTAVLIDFKLFFLSRFFVLLLETVSELFSLMSTESYFLILLEVENSDVLILGSFLKVS